MHADVAESELNSGSVEDLLWEANAESLALASQISFPSTLYYNYQKDSILQSKRVATDSHFKHKPVASSTHTNMLGFVRRVPPPHLVRVAINGS